MITIKRVVFYSNERGSLFYWAKLKNLGWNEAICVGKDQPELSWKVSEMFDNLGINVETMSEEEFDKILLAEC